MRYPCGIQIYDLEATQSDFEQELPIEEAEKVVGGINANLSMMIPEPPPTPPIPCTPPMILLSRFNTITVNSADLLH